MPIQILPPQLANQIAAGEVVERPASVVKELVENSLDAGASQIDIEVEKGGSKLIRVRDNGSGIAEQELVLALSRHATSKITDLDDLEAICSLGFRGEALASISSVSRLTLTSKTADQIAAWQASAAGRDMQVDVRPAAHPIGTSIEVLDLFFNTPARRKFLRTDKTEFGHIDELVKRLALSRYDVGWQLTHNQQSVRRLKPALTDEQRQKRVAALCGRAFAQHAAFIENQYGDVKIWGWIVHPSACSSQLQCQYSYVNGRMMRDKLLNHAIRQAYGDSLSAEQQPAFVLYLELDPRQVDVNVHPAKHEVRFHQARLIHDFVVSALSDALAQLSPMDSTEIPEVDALQIQEPGTTAYASPASYQSTAMPRPINYQAYSSRGQATSSAVVTELSYWQQRQPEPMAAVVVPEPAQTSTEHSTPGYVLTQNRYAIVQHERQLLLIDLIPTMAAYFAQFPPLAQPLLLPQRLTLTETQLKLLTDLAIHFSAAGFDLLITDMTLIVRAVPAFLRQTVLSQWLPLWLDSNLPLGAANPLCSMLSMLLNANSLSAEAMLGFYPDIMTMPKLWCSVPLQLESTLSLLQGADT